MEKKSKFSFQTCIQQFADILVKTVITIDSQQTIELDAGFARMLDILNVCREKNGTVYVLGNGGSAAIASHAVIDFLNMAKMKAMAMLDPAVTTCLSNDFGYEHVYEKQLSQFAASEDVLIAISSSGMSKNILNAVHAAQLHGIPVITLSGFLASNALRQLGDVNLWLDTTDYGQVEIGHAFVLHYLTDCLSIR